MARRKRASMREGPLADLFRSTDESVAPEEVKVTATSNGAAPVEVAVEEPVQETPGPEPVPEPTPEPVPEPEPERDIPLDQATVEYTPPPLEEAEELEEPPAPPQEGEEDVLEETPDFLQETPEHDRLWFEQKPPRDFDLDR